MTSSLSTLHALLPSLRAAADRFAASLLFEDLAALRTVRLQVCKALAACSIADAESLAPVLDSLFEIRGAAGLTSFARTSEEEDALHAHIAAVRAGRAADPVGHLFAALLLSWHACEVGQIDTAIALPRALRTVWAKAAFAMPDLMIHDTDPDVLADYLTELCRSVQRVVRGPAQDTNDLVDGFLSCSAFLQCYFADANLRPLMVARASLLEDLARRIGSGVDQCFRLAPLRDRLRIGFVTLGPTDSSEGAYLAAHLEHLDRTRFEVLLFSLTPRSGVLGEACASYSDRVIALPEQLETALVQIRTFDLDIAVLVNNVTAMVHTAAMIGVHRLGRIQVSNLASPVTTGYRNVDFMLTGQLNEPEDAVEHYAERLLYLAGASNCYDLVPLVVGDRTPATRATYRIPQDAVLYYSSATRYKLQPQVLATWVEILRRVPNSYLLLMPFGSYWGGTHPTAALSATLREHCGQAGISESRIVVAPAVPTVAELHEVMKIADVFLDTFPFSAAVSMYDAIMAGLPYVARAGTQSRGLHSAAISEEAGLFDWIAHTDEDYIARAAALGLSPARRAAAKARIAALRDGGIPMTDTAAFAEKLMAGLEALRADYNSRVARTRALSGEDVKDRIGALSGKVAGRLGLWGDLELIQSVVSPYLRTGGAGTMLDVGACMGVMSVPLLREGWRAILFEPDMRCHENIAHLAAAFPGQARLEKVAVAPIGGGTVTFHLAQATGLSGLSSSAYGEDVATIEVPRINLSEFIAREGLSDVGFIKIDAEGHDLEILTSIDLAAARPRLIMAEFGEHLGGQSRKDVADAIARMDAQGWGACVVCLRAPGSFADQDWRTELQAITVDCLPAADAGTALFGNILFFPRTDALFLRSVLVWLEALAREERAPVYAYEADELAVEN